MVDVDCFPAIPTPKPNQFRHPRRGPGHTIETRMEKTCGPPIPSVATRACCQLAHKEVWEPGFDSDCSDLSVPGPIQFVQRADGVSFLAL